MHGDDTTIPIQAKGKCVTGRIWTYIRDDQPFGEAAAPAAIYYASSDRPANIPRSTWPSMAVFYRATATMASSRSLSPRQRRCRSPLPFAMPIRVGNSLSWPISRKILGITSAKASRPGPGREGGENNGGVGRSRRQAQHRAGDDSGDQRLRNQLQPDQNASGYLAASNRFAVLMVHSRPLAEFHDPPMAA